MGLSVSHNIEVRGDPLMVVPNLRELVGIKASFIQKHVAAAGKTGLDLRRFPAQAFFDAIRLKNPEAVWKVFVESHVGDGQVADVLCLLMAMIAFSDSSRSNRVAMAFRLYCAHSELLDLGRKELVDILSVLLRGTELVLGCSDGGERTEYQRVQGVASRLLSVNDESLDLRIGMREWGQFCRHDVAVVSLLSILDQALGRQDESNVPVSPKTAFRRQELASPATRARKGPPSRSPSRPRSAPSSRQRGMERRDRASEGPENFQSPPRPEMPDPTMSLPENRRRPTPRQRHGDENDEMDVNPWEGHVFEATLPGHGAASENARQRVAPRSGRGIQFSPSRPRTGGSTAAAQSQKSPKRRHPTVPHQDTRKAQTTASASAFSRLYQTVAKNSYRVTVSQIVGVVSSECGVEDESAIFKVFEDSGWYRQHPISEKDFLRVMGQFDFAGSSMAKYVISELRRQLGESRHETALEKKRAANTEDTILHLRKRVAELEQTVQWQNDVVQRATAARNLSGLLSEISALQEEVELGADHAVVLKNIRNQLVTLGSGADAVPAAKAAVRLLETEDRLAQAWREELGILEAPPPLGSHDHDRAYKLLLQWMTEQTNEEMAEHMAKIQQALQVTSTLRSSLQQEAENAEAAASSLRNEVASLRQTGADELRLRAASREELGMREQSTARRIALTEATKKLSALRRTNFLLREARSARALSLARIDGATAAMHGMVRRALRWTALACASVAEATGGDLMSCPPLAILVPEPDRQKVLVDMPKADIQYQWFGDTPEAVLKRVDPFSGQVVLEKGGGHMILYFICACDLSVVGPGIHIPNARAWATKVAPALRWTLILLRKAMGCRTEGSEVPRLPIPVPSHDSHSILEMIEAMLAVFVDLDHPTKEMRVTKELEFLASKATTDQIPAEEENIVRTLQYRLCDALLEVSSTVEKLDPKQECFLNDMTFVASSEGGTGYWLSKQNSERWRSHCKVYDTFQQGRGGGGI